MELRRRQSPRLGDAEHGETRAVRRDTGRTDWRSVEKARVTAAGNPMARGVLDPVGQSVEYLFLEAAAGTAQARHGRAAVRLGARARGKGMEGSLECSSGRRTRTGAP